MLLGVSLIHLRKQMLLYWKNYIKSLMFKVTPILEVNENFIQIKIKMNNNTLLELNLTCIAMK